MQISSGYSGKYVGFFIGLAAFIVMYCFMDVPAGMKPQAWSVACVTMLMAIWWITEAIPIPATGLIPIFAFPALGVMSSKAAAAPYADDVIYLFMGGFFLAVTMEKWNLHRRVALNTIKLVGMSPARLVLGFMVATAFLSMWVSNSACAMMMVPIGLAVVGEITGLTAADIKAAVGTKNPDLNFGRALMLGIAFAASIGGIATIIGTPPNAILVGIVRQMYGYEIGFGQWMIFGVPLSLVTLFATWYILCFFLFRSKELSKGSAEHIIDDELKKLGPVSGPEARIIFVAVLMATLWIIRGFVFKHFPMLKFVNDSTIAIGGSLLLFALPLSLKKHEFLLDWNTAVKIPWDVILLFGGGLAIANGFMSTGLTKYVAEQFSLLRGLHIFWFMFLIAIFTISLTEVTSNTATATLLVPIMGTVAVAVGVNPLGPMIATAVSASFAFMLPVATPPNAVAYGSGCFTIKDMAVAGIWINLFSFFLIPAAIFLLLPILWGEPLTSVPEWALKAVAK